MELHLQTFSYKFPLTSFFRGAEREQSRVMWVELAIYLFFFVYYGLWTDSCSLLSEG